MLVRITVGFRWRKNQNKNKHVDGKKKKRRRRGEKKNDDDKWIIIIKQKEYFM